MEFFSIAAIVIFFACAVYCLVTGSFTAAIFLAAMGVVCIINHKQQVKRDAEMREIQEKQRQWKQNHKKNRRR